MASRHARALPFAAALLLAAAPVAARAATGDCATSPDVAQWRPVINVRVDNDLFGGVGQDRGYSHGFQVTAMSRNLKDFDDPECLPWIVRGINRSLDWLHPEGLDEKNVVVGFGQALFTPSVREATELLPDDRPYAAALLAGVGYNARSGDRLRTAHLRVGVVGPAALGEPVQNGWHRLIGVPPWLGWRNQLRNEPVFQLVHERMQRWAAHGRGTWGVDLIGHWGGSLGNYATYANAGAELRFGVALPDDFGSDPLRPAGENTAPVRRARADAGWAWHVFVSVDARAVAHHVALDGNAWRASHRVDRRVFVADLGQGIAITHGPWKLAFAHYHRTREFRGQQLRPVFGSVTISRRF